RSFFRTLKEFREVEAAAAEARAAEARAAEATAETRAAAEAAASGAGKPDVTPEGKTGSGTLGSFFPATPRPPAGVAQVPVRGGSGPPEVPGTVGGGRSWVSDPPR